MSLTTAAELEGGGVDKILGLETPATARRANFFIHKTINREFPDATTSKTDIVA